MQIYELSFLLIIFLYNNYFHGLREHHGFISKSATELFECITREIP